MSDLNRQIKEALIELVRLKNYKDKYGKDEHYIVEQPLAWNKAKVLLRKANGENEEQDKALHLRGVSRCFNSESELRLHIEKSIPIAIKPTRKSKTTFVYPFTSYKAKEAVVECIVESLLNNG